MSFGSSKSSSQNQSQQTSESKNQAFPFLQGALGGQVSNVGSGSNILASLLGLNGSSAGAEAFNTYKNSSGYDFIQNEGMKGINANNAAKGLLGSGSALKEISKYNTGLASSFLDKYLASLSNFTNTGLSSAQILAQAGNTANSQGTSSGTSYGKSTSIGLG